MLVRRCWSCRSLRLQWLVDLLAGLSVGLYAYNMQISFCFRLLKEEIRWDTDFRQLWMDSIPSRDAHSSPEKGRYGESVWRTFFFVWCPFKCKILSCDPRGVATFCSDAVQGRCACPSGRSLIDRSYADITASVFCISAAVYLKQPNLKCAKAKGGVTEIDTICTVWACC